MRVGVDKARYDGGGSGVDLDEIGSRADRSAEIGFESHKNDPAPVCGHRRVAEDAEVSKCWPKPRAITAQRRELPDVADDEIGLRKFVAHVFVFNDGRDAKPGEGSRGTINPT